MRNFRKFNAVNAWVVFAGAGLMISIPALAMQMLTRTTSTASFENAALVILLLIWAVVISAYIPKCQKCGLGYFSEIEMLGFPLVPKFQLGNRCSHCGHAHKM